MVAAALVVLVVGVVPLRRWLLLHADRDGDERRQAPHAAPMHLGGGGRPALGKKIQPQLNSAEKWGIAPK